MFLTGEDFYYFTYSILLLLKVLGCENGRVFKDYRKLPFLMEFLSDENLLYILESYSSEMKDKSRQDQENNETKKRPINRLDKEYLFKSYSTGMAKRSEVLKLLFTLEKSEYILLEKAGLQTGVDVSLTTEKIPEGFFDKEIFAKEFANALRLKKVVKRLTSLSLETMLEKIYNDNGVKTWAL